MVDRWVFDEDGLMKMVLLIALMGLWYIGCRDAMGDRVCALHTIGL